MIKLKKCPAPITAAAVVLCILASAALGTNASAIYEKQQSTEGITETAKTVPAAAKPPQEQSPAQNVVTEAAQETAETPAVPPAQPAAELPSESPAPTSGNSVTVNSKSDASSDRVSFEATPLDGNSSVSDIPSISEQSGADCITGDYASEIAIKSVGCGQNGGLSVFLDLNADILESMVIRNSETGEQIMSTTVLIDGKTAYSFSGLDPDTRYDVLLLSQAPEWEVEGKYFIY